MSIKNALAWAGLIVMLAAFVYGGATVFLDLNAEMGSQGLVNWGLGLGLVGTWVWMRMSDRSNWQELCKTRDEVERLKALLDERK